MEKDINGGDIYTKEIYIQGEHTNKGYIYGETYI